MQSNTSEQWVTLWKLGFFDSWVGGLTVMTDFRSIYPELDMVYFGDRANCPYGDRSPGDIRALTLAGVERLVAAGCVIIILACNTAATHTIQYLQQEVYPPGSRVKILGVTVPGIEAVLQTISTVWSIGVLATRATVEAWVYSRKLYEWGISVNNKVFEIAAPGLVNIIEQSVNIGAHGNLEFSPSSTNLLEIRKLLWKYLIEFPLDIEFLVLGCTHYPIISDLICEVWQELNSRSIHIIDPGVVSAESFRGYLERHGEFDISRYNSTTIFWS